jgi:chromosome segregation ATPase
MKRFPTKDDQEDEMPLDREIRVKEEGPDFSTQDEMWELRRESHVQKLKQRITLLSILIPCLLGAIILFVYLEFNDRLNKIMITKTGQVEALSKNMDDRIVSLSHHSTELEKLLSDSIANLKKTNGLIEKDLEKNQREIKKLTRSKADNKTLEQAIRQESAQTAKTLGALRNTLNGQKQAIENLDATLKKEVVRIVQVIETLKTDRQRQDSAIKDLSEHKIDKEDFGSILEDKWSGYQARIALLQKEIKALREEVSKVQGQLDMGMTSNMESKAKGASAKEKPSAATTKNAAIPTPGDIIEQGITE